jgi:hypothetical protein
MFVGTLGYRNCAIRIIAVFFKEGFLNKNLEKGLKISSGWNRSTVQIQNTNTRTYVYEEH